MWPVSTRSPMRSWRDRVRQPRVPVRITICSLAVAVALCSACSKGRPPDDPFPPAPGLEFDGPPVTYGPSSLFEYINGAAESYLAYGFESLASQTYLEGGEPALVADVYRHRDLTNAFGMYAQERPDTGPFVDVGAEGYAQPGVVNFFKGPYYVKIMSYRTVANRDGALLELAREIAARLGGVATLPAGVGLLPSEQRVPHSERFIAQHFLGHEFLHSAFAAEYETENGERVGFLLMPDDARRAVEMRDAYAAYAEQRGSEVTSDGLVTTFVDPYYRASGAVSVALLDGVVFGMFGVERAHFERMVDGVRSGLEAEARGRL